MKWKSNSIAAVIRTEYIEREQGRLLMVVQIIFLDQSEYTEIYTVT